MRYLIIILSLFLSGLSFAQQSYTLESFISEMLQKDFGILILKNTTEIAKNNNNVGNAGYLPTLNVTANDNISSSNAYQLYFSGLTKEANGAKSSSLTATAILNWTFFDGFRMFATDKKLDLLEDQAQLNLTAEMEMKIYQATVLFYTLVQQQKLDDVYKQAIDLSKARYDLTLLKKNNGAASDIQLIQARLDLSADSSAYLQNQKAIENLKADLNLFLAKEPLEPFTINGDIAVNSAIDWDNTLEDAKAQNTSLLLAKSTIAIREKERKEAQSYFYPQLSVFGQYAFSKSKSQVSTVNFSRNVGPGVGISLQWSILNRLTNYTNVKNSKVQLETAQLTEQQQEYTIETELRKTYNEYEWAKRNLDMEQLNIDQTQLNVDIAKNAYKNGSITNLELREIQFSIVQAQSRYVEAQLAYKTAELNLSLITGNFKKLLA